MEHQNTKCGVVFLNKKGYIIVDDDSKQYIIILVRFFLKNKSSIMR